MKRIGHLFEQAFSRDNLYHAYLDARKGKRNKRACFQFELSLGFHLEKIYQELWTDRYRPKPYFKFIIYEPKERTIYAPSFRDVVVQHAIYRVIYPIFDKTFISTSFACQVGYGTHKASAAAQRMLRQCKPDDYTLKLDLRKFFYRIDRAILERQIRQKIKDERLIKIMMQFADYEGPIGIPIGNLLSQIYALIYLNPLDHFIKRELKVKHYLRYVDDFILIGLSRDQCLDYRQRIIQWLDAELAMTLSKSTIQKVKRGLNFVGYRTWCRKKFIRKHSLYKFKQSVKKGKLESCISILGHARQTASLTHLLNYAREINHGLYRSLPQTYHRIHNHRITSAGIRERRQTDNRAGHA